MQRLHVPGCRSEQPDTLIERPTGEQQHESDTGAGSSSSEDKQSKPSWATRLAHSTDVRGGMQRLFDERPDVYFLPPSTARASSPDALPRAESNGARSSGAAQRSGCAARCRCSGGPSIRQSSWRAAARVATAHGNLQQRARSCPRARTLLHRCLRRHIVTSDTESESE